MASVRYMTCTACNRSMGADLGSTTLKVGICKMCREDPQWLDRHPEVRKAIARSNEDWPRIGISFKGSKPKTRHEDSFESFRVRCQNPEPSVAQLLSHPINGMGSAAAHNSRDKNPVGDKENPMGVRAGQLWRSLDKRERDHSTLGDRYVLVQRVLHYSSPPVAHVQSFWMRGDEETSTRRSRQLKLSTFEPKKGRGFELVDEDGYANSLNNPYGVAVGQRWRALDPRRKGAVVEIRQVDEDAGVARYVDASGQLRDVKLYNFKKTKGRGYALESL